jgi:Uma2 family endonuclease
MAAMVSSAPTSSIPPGELVSTADQRIVMYGLSWDDFKTLLALRGENACPRMAYLDGAVELMSPSQGHEEENSMLGSLVEHYCIERNILVKPYGSWLVKKKRKKAGLEPDECYCFGPKPGSKPVPDLAIEVVWTSGGIDKLEIYRRLKIGEVWFWINDAITVYVLEHHGYEPRPRSTCLPDIDLALLCSLAKCETMNEAVHKLRAALR